MEPNAVINQIENSIKDWLKLASLRVSIAEARTLKTNLTKVTFQRFSLFRRLTYIHNSNNILYFYEIPFQEFDIDVHYFVTGLTELIRVLSVFSLL